MKRPRVRANGAAAGTVQLLLPRPLQSPTVRLNLAVKPAGQESAPDSTCTPAREASRLRKLPPVTNLAADPQASSSRDASPLPAASTKLSLEEEHLSRITPASFSQSPERVAAINSLPLPGACTKNPKAEVFTSRIGKPEQPAAPTKSLTPPGLRLPGACPDESSQAAILASRTLQQPAAPKKTLPLSRASTSSSTASTRGSVPPKLRKYYLSKEDEPTAVTFKSYCKSKGVTKTRKAPGDKDASTSTTTDCDRVMRELMGLFGGLHNQANKSLRGRYTINNFYVTEEGQVRLHGNVKLRTKTTSRANSDFHTLARELRSHIFDEEEPAEISCWMDMMSSNALARELSVRCPSALMSPCNKLALCNWLYKRLWTIEHSNKRKYHKILKRIPYAHRWKILAKGNLFLHQQYYSEGDDGKRKSFYPENARGLLRFIRNVIEHIHEKGLRGRSLLFEEWEVADMICSTFPLLIGSLQEAVELQGELLDHPVEAMNK